MLHLDGLRLGHANSETVQAEPVAVDFLGSRCGPCQHLVLFNGEALGVDLNRCTAFIEARQDGPGATRYLAERRTYHFGMVLGCRGGLELHDIDSCFEGMFAKAGQIEAGQRATLAHSACVLRQDGSR